MVAERVVEPVTYGPRGMPERTLAWDLMAWCSRYLQNIDGRRWIFTREQARFVAWWYALDEAGGWLYRRGILRRMKGWGKDPLAAVLSIAEWIGPCRFGGWHSDGSPIAVREPAAWIQVAASTATQAEQNTMSLFPALIPWAMQRELGLRLGIKACWAPGRRRIQSVSNSSRGLEGSRPTFVVAGETQHWVSGNGGLRLAEVISRNLAKSPGGRARTLAVTNAHMDGEGSVAERDWAARDAGDVLYDSREAPSDLNLTDDGEVLAGIIAARGDSYWIDAHRVLQEFRDPATDEALGVRFFHNRIVAGSGRWMDPSTWSAAATDEKPPEDGRKITLGFDGSRTRDATALVGTDLETGYQWVIGVWERDWTVAEWEVPIDEVHRLVDEVRAAWTVMRFYADPSWWEESVSKWQADFERPDGKPAVANWYTGGGRITRMARSVRAYQDAVETGGVVHERNPRFDAHMLAAHKDVLRGRAGEDGLHVIRKASRSSLESIDIAMAAILSWQACLDARAQGDLDEDETVPLKVWLPPGM